MAAPDERPVEVYRLHPATLWVTVFVALLVQAFLPLRVPVAQHLDLPLLVTIYVALLRRDKVFAIVLGTGLGLMQDALSHTYMGIFGMAKALIGYIAAFASLKFDLEQFAGRLLVTGILIGVHSASLLGLQQGLLESPPSFHPVDLGSGMLVNLGVGLLLFQVLDRFRRPA